MESQVLVGLSVSVWGSGLMKLDRCCYYYSVNSIYLTSSVLQGQWQTCPLRHSKTVSLCGIQFSAFSTLYSVRT